MGHRRTLAEGNFKMGRYRYCTHPQSVNSNSLHSMSRRHSLLKHMVSGKRIEILAPAGSFESFLAAVRAGADAVYAGGPCFGARAFADNFSEERLLEAIDYAHLHGRRFYLTVNTLLKDSELDRLSGYLSPLYEQGLDAVIVQDVGVLEFVREHFPELSVHASTQMTVTNALGALFLKEQGVERVVPARELSLAEVREIADRTGMEVECFVHGALCYCYSGQCLMSSLIGGRSGNRGQCAQPCRLPYTVDGKREYVLSLKDICTLERIPELIEAGIDSFKIEGRMKKPEYVGLVTAMYRKYTDMYLEKGKGAYRVSEEDKEKLLDIYNRGGFSGGYYGQHNGRDMLSLSRPSHAGVPAVRVLAQKGREVTGVVLTEIHKGDILELTPGGDYADTKYVAGKSKYAACKSKHIDELNSHEFERKLANYTFGKDAVKGGTVKLLVPPGERFSKGTVLYRIRNQALLDELSNTYGTGAVKEPISGVLQVSPGEPARLTVSYGEMSVTAVTDEPVEEAKSQPLEGDRLKKQLQKTGNTDFYFQGLDIEMGGAVFLPMQRMNELRRRALELLEHEICGRYRRTNVQKPDDGNGEANWNVGSGGDTERSPYLSALAESKEQLEVLVHSPDVRRIYVDSSMSPDVLCDGELRAYCEECRRMGKEFFLAMPPIFRRDAIRYFTAKAEEFLRFGFDGVLIRNYESFPYLKKVGFDKKVILDHNLYIFNQQAKRFWLRQQVEAFTVPVELNEQEIGRLGVPQAELIVYGRLPVMVSAQCMAKTTGTCTNQPGLIHLKDRYQKDFPVRTCCHFCYNVMYHAEVLYLADLQEPIRRLAPKGLRMQFTLEDAQETARIVAAVSRDIYHRNTCHRSVETAGNSIYNRNVREELPELAFTRGHFNRGVT